MRKEIVSLGVCTLSLVLLCGAQLSAQIKVVDQGWRAAPVTQGPTIVTANRMIVAQSVPVKTRVVASPSLAPPDMVPAPATSPLAAPVVVASPQVVYMVPTRSTYYVQNRIPVAPVGGPAPVTYGSACGPCQQSYYVPQQRQVVMAPTYRCAPAVPYRVARPLPSKYYYGKGLDGQPKLYVDNQPVRNALRWLSL